MARIIKMPEALLGEKLECRYAKETLHSHADRLVLVGSGLGVYVVCMTCLWHFCDTCNYDRHRCPGCGTVTDHFDGACDECIAQIDQERREVEDR